MNKCCGYCNCDACRARRLEMRELQLIDEMGAAERANAMHIEALKTCRRERDEARADLRRLQNTDPQRIARLLREARERDRLDFEERRRDSAQALEIVCKKLEQASFLISEAMKRLENENVPAAYASLKAAISWIDDQQPTVDEKGEEAVP